MMAKEGSFSTNSAEPQPADGPVPEKAAPPVGRKRSSKPQREFAPVETGGVPAFIGTSGWAYTIWKPQFYPEDVGSKDFLKFYATQLSAVEVNYTFRRMLTEKAAASWMQCTGPNFRFSPKIHQSITHFKRLKNVEESLRFFLGAIEPLQRQRKLGPVLVQLPPNLKADQALLRDFLAQLPKVARFAFEFRHNSWFTDETYNALREHNASLCVAETEDLTTPEIATADFIYFRFRRPSYSETEVDELVRRVSQHLKAGVETYAFFKHEEDPRSPLNAVRLLQNVLTEAGSGSAASTSRAAVEVPSGVSQTERS